MRFGRLDIAMKQIGLLLTALLLVSDAVNAQTHVIDVDRARAGFWIRPAWFKRIEGVFPVLEGVASWSQTNGDLRVDVHIDMRALQMNNGSHLSWAQSKDFFDVEQHPWARFHSDAISAKELHDGGAIAGEMTVRGISQRVRFTLEPATCDQPGIVCPVHASGEVSRSAFGMDARRLAIRDTVHMDISVYLVPLRVAEIEKL